MKVILGNLPYNANGENLPFFNSILERNTYLSNNVYTTEWKDGKSFKQTSQTLIEVKMKNNKISEGFKYNFMSVEVQGKVTHYNIIGSYSPNAKTVTYTGIVDMHMNFPLLMGEVENFMMTQGHYNKEKYKGLYFDGGDSETKSFDVLTPIRKSDNLYSKGWIYIFKKITDYETGTIYYNTAEFIEMPYKVFIVPTDFININSEYYWDSRYIKDFLDNDSGNILGVRMSAYNPIILKDGVDIADVDDNSIDNGEWYEYEIENSQTTNKGRVLQLTYLNPALSDKFNSYKVELEDNSILENIDGVRKWKLTIENLKEIEVPEYVITFPEEGNAYFNFTHYFIPTPDHCEEYVKFSEGDEEYYSFRDGNNTFENSKELSYAVNAFDVYSANNPISAKLEVIGSALNGFLTGSSLTTFFMGDKILSGSFFDRIPKGSLMESYEDVGGMDMKYAEDMILGEDLTVGLGKLGKMSMTFGAIGAARRVTKTIVNRQNMKKSSNKVKGDGTLTPDLSLNHSFYSFIYRRLNYTTTERESIVNSIYMNGIAHNNVIVNKFSDIKRSKFNMVNIVNLDVILPEKYYKEWGTEVINNLMTFHQKEKRYWYDTNNIGDFDFDTRSDNE